MWPKSVAKIRKVGSEFPIRSSRGALTPQPTANAQDTLFDHRIQLSAPLALCCYFVLECLNSIGFMPPLRETYD